MLSLRSVVACIWLLFILSVPINASGQVKNQTMVRESPKPLGGTITGTVFILPTGIDQPGPKPCVVITGTGLKSHISLGCCPPTPDCLPKLNDSTKYYEYPFKSGIIPPGKYTVKVILYAQDGTWKEKTVAYARVANKFDRAHQADASSARSITIGKKMKGPVRVDIYAVEEFADTTSKKP